MSYHSQLMERVREIDADKERVNQVVDNARRRCKRCLAELEGVRMRGGGVITIIPDRGFAPEWPDLPGFYLVDGPDGHSVTDVGSIAVAVTPAGHYRLYMRSSKVLEVNSMGPAMERIIEEIAPHVSPEDSK